MTHFVDMCRRRLVPILLISALVAALTQLPAVPIAAQSTKCRGRSATIVGTPGDDRLIGTGRNDVIAGRGGDDHIEGRGGNDIICGGGGEDMVIGGGGRDLLLGGAGNDVLRGGGRKDFLVGGGGSDRLFGGVDSDVLRGGPGSDVLRGGKGHDFLLPGNGNDRVAGGQGRDTADYSTSKRGLQADLKRGTIRGQGNDRVSRIKVLIGTEQRDVIRGSGRADVLIGVDGADLIVGRGGNDILAPGGGRTTLRGGRGTDLASYAFEDRAVRVDLAKKGRFHSIEGLQGSLFSDRLWGTSGRDVLQGLGGYDRLFGRGGNDRLVGGGARDTLVGGAGNDKVFGGPDQDTLVAGPGNDVLDGGPREDVTDYGRAPNPVVVDLAEGIARGFGTDVLRNIEDVAGSKHADELFGNGRKNTMSGAGGDDLLEGRGHRDALSGGAGTDAVRGGRGNDRLAGGNGNDFLEGDAGDDQLSGHAGNDRLDGGEGNDHLDAGSGTDLLIGGPGDDTLAPGAGDDHLEGGPGADAVSLAAATDRAEVDVAAGRGRVVEENEFTFTGVENVRGSRYDDEIFGDDGANSLVGGGGSDTAHGRAGDDEVIAEFADGGPDVDLCDGRTEHVNCEILSPAPPALERSRPDTGSRPPEGYSFAPRDDPDPDPAPSAASSVAFQADAAHSGALPDLDLPSPMVRRWSRNLEGEVSYPVIVDGRVFVIVRDDDANQSLLYALSADEGETLWTASMPGYSAIAYGDGRLYWTAPAGWVRALDPATGAVIWDEEIPFGIKLTGTPVVDSGELYVEGARSGLFSLDAATGRVRWGSEALLRAGGSPALSATRAYSSFPAGLNFAFDRGDGTRLWNFDAGGWGVTPAYYEGRVYIYRDGWVVDAETGEEKGYFDSWNIPAFSGSTGMFMSQAPFPTSFELRAEDIYGGGTRWTFTGDNDLHYEPPPLIVGDTVFVASGTATLFAVDLNSGELKWRAPLPARPFARAGSFPVSGMGAGPGILVVPMQSTLTAFGG